MIELHDPFPTAGVPYYAGKRIGVTGATGLIGSYVVKLLRESGAHVIAFVNRRPRNPFTEKADQVLYADLASDSGLTALNCGLDALLHCAGITGGVNLPSIDPVSYVGPATAMNINVLHACHKYKVPAFAFLSSTTVYPPSEWPVIEEDAGKDEPYRLYRGIAKSKFWFEQLCKYYQETTGINTSIIRPAGAYGRFDNFDEKTSHVLPGMVERAIRCAEENASTFEVWGDGNDIRDFIHAQDVAMYMLLATAKHAVSDPINAASGKDRTIGELARTVLSAADCNAEIKFDPSKPSALKRRSVSIKKAKELLGYEPQISLADGILDVVKWRKLNK